MNKKIAFAFLFLLLTFNAQTQSKEEILNMIKAFSYYNGIEKTLDCIIDKYPNLSTDAIVQKLKLIEAHKSSEDFLKGILMDKLGGEYYQLELQLTQAISCDLLTSQASREYLENLFNDRIQGNHNTYAEFVQLLLKYNPKYTNNNLKEFTDNFRTKYSTKDHPKSKGLHFSISFPKSWIILEGSRPNIIMKAEDQRNKGMYLMLITKEFLSKSEFKMIINEEGLDIKTREYKEFIKNSIFTEDFINGLREETTEFNVLSETKLDGQPALIYYSATPNERAGIQAEIHQNTAIVIYKNYLIFISLGVASVENSFKFDYSKIENGNMEMLFKSIINTLVIDDQWK